MGFQKVGHNSATNTLISKSPSPTLLLIRITFVFRGDQVEHLNIPWHRKRIKVSPRKNFVPQIQVFYNIYKHFKMDRRGLGIGRKKRCGFNCFQRYVSVLVKIQFAIQEQFDFLKYLFILLCSVLVVACQLLVGVSVIQFPDQGSNPGPLHQKHGVLATGPPGKSQFFTNFYFSFLLDI